MVKKKSKSKRVGLKDKYKIIRKVKEHNSKMKKLTKARASEGLVRRVKRDPGVPNLFPLKDRILQMAERKLESQGIYEKQLKEKRRAAIEKRRREKMVEKGRHEVEYHEIKANEMNKHMNDSDVTKRRWYYKELNKTIDNSDVVLMVLDARDPMGCRCLEIEQKVIAQTTVDGKSKKLLLVLNKIDLVPKEVVAKWITYLRREYPTIAFKASTQKKGQVTQLKVGIDQAQSLQHAGCIGGDALLQLLKNYSRTLDRKKAITVGCIGYPNTGKSSVINSLTRKWAAGVGAQPGFTKVVQTIKLDGMLDLLDSPGVMFSNQTDDKDLALRNCLKLEHVEDPIEAAHRIVEKVSRETLMELYQTASFESAHEFLLQVAQRRGKLKKGGVPNIEMAARAVLKDWFEGAIPYYTLPPDVNDRTGSAEVVSGWSDSFDLDAFLQTQNDTTMQAAGEVQLKKPTKFSVITSSGLGKLAQADMSDDDDDTRSTATSSRLTSVRSMATGTKKNKRRQLAMESREDAAKDTDIGGFRMDDNEGEEDEYVGASGPMKGLGLQRNKLIKQSLKKQKKEKKREMARRSSVSAGIMEDDDDDGYSFEAFDDAEARGL